MTTQSLDQVKEGPENFQKCHTALPNWSFSSDLQICQSQKTANGF